MIPQRWLCLGWVITAATLGAPLALAQQDAPARRDTESAPIFTFSITPEMLSNGLDLLVEKRLTKDYGLDPYQQEQMRQVLHEHVPRFLREHRGDLEKLWVEWTEAISAGQPPDPEYAAQWAGRLMPIVEETRGLVDNVSEEMRGFLDDEQQVMLDGYLAAVDIGVRNVTGRLQVFKQGGFDPAVHWPGYANVRRADPARVQKLRRSMEHARQGVMSGAVPRSPRRPKEKPTPASGERAADVKLVGDAKVKAAAQAKDEWTRYVEAFISRYRLNEEQKQKAYMLLKHQTEQRDKYLASKARRMEQVERLFKGAKTSEQVKLAESAYQELRQPIERMFERLKENLEKLPTRAQRRTAALAEKKPVPAGGSAPTGKGDARRP